MPDPLIPPSARLYGIVDLGYVEEPRALDAAEAMIAGGIGILQLRAKGIAPPAVRMLAGRIAPVARAAGIPFIVNDYPDIAAAVDADGAHVGQDDGAVAAARAAWPAGTRPRPLVGRSTHSLAQAEAAVAEGADYIGFGPLFATPTKPGRPAIGLGDIAEAHRRLPDGFPIFCIGGIHPGNLEEVIDAGARRVVIVSAILRSPDIRSTVRAVADRLAAAAEARRTGP